MLRASLLSTIFVFLGHQALFPNHAYPGGLVAGQLAFSAEALQAQLAVLAAEERLEAFALAQRFDFLFIASYSALLFVLLCTPRDAFAKRRATWLLVITVALSDGLENALMLGFIEAPQTLTEGRALAYSTFAAVKWAGLALGRCAYRAPEAFRYTFPLTGLASRMNRPCPLPSGWPFCLRPCCS